MIYAFTKTKNLLAAFLNIYDNLLKVTELADLKSN